MLGFAALAEVALVEVPQSIIKDGDLINYIFRFDSQGAALADNHVGPLLSWLSEVLIYNPLQKQSTVALSGFWCMVTKRGSDVGLLLEDQRSVLELEDKKDVLVAFPNTPVDLGFALHPNIKIVNDQTLMAENLPSVVLANIDVSDINIVQNVIGVYVRDGLQLI